MMEQSYCPQMKFYIQLDSNWFTQWAGWELHFLIDLRNLKEEIVMEIVSKTEGSKVTMEITGWLDTQTAPQLEKELSALDPGTTSLVFDFANLEYISSAGLRLVIADYKKMAGKEGFRIVNVSDEVYDVFSLTGFDQKINIEKK